MNYKEVALAAMQYLAELEESANNFAGSSVECYQAAQKLEEAKKHGAHSDGILNIDHKIEWFIKEAKRYSLLHRQNECEASRLRELLEIANGGEL